MSFAVIRTGGKQYKINAGDKIYIERIASDVGEKISFNDVLFHSSKDTSGLLIEGMIVDQIRSKKILIFKKKRRNNYRRKNGHRQYITVVKFGEF